NPEEIAVQGRYVYIVGQSPARLFIIDVTDPVHPTFVNGAQGLSLVTGSPTAMYVQGRYVYIGSSTGAGSKIEVYDVGNPASPVFLSSVTTGVSVRTLQGQGTYL